MNTELSKNSPLDTLKDDFGMTKFRVNLWAICILILLLLVSSNFAKLDEVAIATGEVVPQEQLKIVQHLEGGIVEQIFVREGDYVQQGAIVMQLDLGASAVNRKEILARLDGLTLTEARLDAEIKNLKAPQFNSEIVARRPDIHKSELAIFKARKQELTSRVAVTNERINQKKLEVDEMLAHQRALDRDLNLAKERFEMSGTLVQQGLVPRMEHISLEAEVSKMEGELEVMLASLPRAKAAYEEAKAQLAEERQAFSRRAIEELGELRMRTAQLRETLETASDQERRADVRAPIEGIVKTLRFNTIGGVVKPGEPIMDIVPSSDELVIRAKLDPKDRGYVIEGLKANVKVSTFDYARYGDLEGVVERIAASTDMGEDGVPYYTVIVKTDKNYLGEQKGEFAIQPGCKPPLTFIRASALFLIISPALF